MEIDSAVKLVMQPLLKPATSSEIVAAVEECRLVAGISKNQLACFLIDNRGCDGWFIAYVVDVVRDEADEADSFFSGSGERLVLRPVEFRWDFGGWMLDASDSVSDPGKWSVGDQVLSRNPSES